MLQTNEDLVAFVATGTIMFLLLGFFLINFLFVYQKRQLEYFKEKERLKNAFQDELLTAHLEIHEHILKNISQEIHDNIGQVLSFIKLSLSSFKMLSEKERLDKINDTRELVAYVINELRDLSKSLSYEKIAEKGLSETIRFETERINKSATFNILFKIEGQIMPLGNQRELVLYRIFQESIHNIVSHSRAQNVKILLQYSPEIFNLILQDDGIGFCEEDVDVSGGMGIKNMKNRAILIGAKLSILTSVKKGCLTTVTLALP
jgi:signal transduction histidine kinase